MVVTAISRIKQSKETLKMKALRFFEMSATTFQSKRSHIPETRDLQESGNGILKSHKLWFTENIGNFLNRWISVSTYKKNSRIFYDATDPSGPGPPHYRGFTIGFLWTSDQLYVETFPWRRTTLKRDRHPCPRRDSNPQCQQGSGHRLRPPTARPLGPALVSFTKQSFSSNVRSRLFQISRLGHINFSLFVDSPLISNIHKLTRQGTSWQNNSIRVYPV
jgi:hypothetical protein